MNVAHCSIARVRDGMSEKCQLARHKRPGAAECGFLWVLDQAAWQDTGVPVIVCSASSGP